MMVEASVSLKSPKVAVVGCGYWGRNIVRSLAQLDALAAICEENDIKAQAISKEFEVPNLSYHDILKDETIQGIMIATPTATHFPLAQAALQAKKHVFIEKPLARNTQEAIALVEEAQKAQCFVMVGHLLHYHPAFIALQHLIKAGELGDILTITAHRLGLGKLWREESVLWDYLPHDFSMILGLMGAPIEAVAAEEILNLSPTVADSIRVTLKFENGKRASAYASRLNPQKEHKLTVIGTKAMAVFEDTTDWENKLKVLPYQLKEGILTRDISVSEMETVKLEPAEPLKVECAHFIDCIKNGALPKTSVLEGLAVLQILEAADTALKQQRKSHSIAPSLN